MARNARYRVALRRRREGKTDYQARKAMVLSGKPRVVARCSLKNVSVQVVVAKPVGDMVTAAAHSRELVKFGWKAPAGNVPAAYLTGFLCGLKAKAKGVAEAILDIGLVAPSKGSKLFAVASGIVDAGVSIPFDEGKVAKEALRGEHIAKYAKSLAVGSEVYSAKFSKYLAAKVAPEKLPELFGKVKAEIAAAFKAEVKAKPAEAKAKPADVKGKAKAKVEAELEAESKAKGKVVAKQAAKKVSKKSDKKA